MPCSIALLAAFALGATRAAPASDAHPRPSVAVLDFSGPGTDPSDLSAATSRFETELQSLDSFLIVERRNIDRILKEQGFQQSGACDSSGCSVEIGRILSVQEIFTGELTRTGRMWSLTVRRIDVSTGRTLFSHALDVEGDFADLLRGGVPEMALIASGRRKPDSDRSVLVARRSAWPWVVGGAVLAGGGIAAAILVARSGSGSGGQETSSAAGSSAVEIRW